MHNRANLSATPLCSYIRWNVPGCKHPLVYWHAEATWALGIRDCKDIAWALTWEWVLSIRAAKTSTWALILEWVLARDTTVFAKIKPKIKCLDYCVSSVATSLRKLLKHAYYVEHGKILV